jgi:phage shock protein C
MAGNNDQYRKLERSRTNSVLAGVCGGLGEYFGIDPVIFRIIFAVVFFGYGTGLGIYIILYFVMPLAPKATPHFEAETQDEDDHHDDDEWSDF